MLRRRLFNLPTLTAHRVLLAKVGGVEKVVGRLLKGGQHQDALLHLGQSEPGDAQDFTLHVQEVTNKKKQINNEMKYEAKSHILFASRATFPLST